MASFVAEGVVALAATGTAFGLTPNKPPVPWPTSLAISKMTSDPSPESNFSGPPSLPSISSSCAYPPPVPGAVFRCYMRNSAPFETKFYMIWTHVSSGVYGTTAQTGHVKTGLGNVTLKVREGKGKELGLLDVDFHFHIQ